MGVCARGAGRLRRRRRILSACESHYAGGTLSTSAYESFFFLVLIGKLNNDNLNQDKINW